MSSYYFPFGGGTASTIQNINHSLLAVTASAPFSQTITTLTASFATTSGSVPSAGPNGTNQTAQSCGPSTILGPIGVSGSRGPTGPNNVSCPPGTIACPDLDQFLPALNTSASRASGSQFVKVCMEIPPGCTSVTATCPPYLPSASVVPKFPNIP